MVVGSLITVNPSSGAKKRLSFVVYHEDKDTFSFAFRKRFIRAADPDKLQAAAQKLSQNTFIEFDDEALGEIGYSDKLSNTQKS